MKVSNFAADFVKCEDHRVCLSTLTGSAAAKQLRSRNRLQLICLEDPSQLTQLHHDVVSPCNRWRTCLQKAQIESDMLRLLNAGLAARTKMVSFLESAQSCTDASGCIDPPTTDAEGWACNCLDEWKAKCADIGEQD